MTEVIDGTDPATADAVAARVASVLTDGGVVVLPTDTVYGLAACPDDADAMARIFALKGRGSDVPVAVLCASVVQALSLAAGVGSTAAVLGARHWPGPLTLVLRRHPDLEWSLGQPDTTIGVRCPAHPLVAAVTGRIGPIATTSANRHGEPTPVEAAPAASSLLGPVDLVVDGGILSGDASTVVDATSDAIHVLREGPIAITESSADG